MALFVFDWTLCGVGLAVLAIIVFALAQSLLRGIRLSASLHCTMYRGMRLNGRSPKWARFPGSFIWHAWEMGSSTASFEITGDGWKWSSDGVRSIWNTAKEPTP